MENNWLHKFGANSIFYNVAMKALPFLSHILIWSFPVCFAVAKCPSETSIYLSVSTNYPGIKSEISGVMWQGTPESKIKLVSCDILPKCLLGLSALEDIFAINAYIFCDSFCSVLLSCDLYILFNIYTQVLDFYVFQWTLLIKVSGFRQFMMMWSSDPHLKEKFGFQLLS